MQSKANPPALPVMIQLQAIDRSRNIARGYTIEAQPDLFGHWIIDLHWGRIGSRGQGRTLSFEVEHDANCFICSTLARRRSAKQRIGVGYLMVSTPQ